jgi:hypothetical protein
VAFAVLAQRFAAKSPRAAIKNALGDDQKFLVGTGLFALNLQEIYGAAGTERLSPAFQRDVSSIE